MTGHTPTRRDWLLTLGSVATASLAGCPSNTGGDGEGGGSTPNNAEKTPTAESETATQTATEPRTPTQTPTATTTASTDPGMQVVQEFYAAANDGNFEQANTLIHPDSPDGNITEQQQAVFERQTIEVQRLTLLETTDSRVVMNATLELTRDGRKRTTSTELELRRDSGEWKLYTSG